VAFTPSQSLLHGTTKVNKISMAALPFLIFFSHVMAMAFLPRRDVPPQNHLTLTIRRTPQHTARD
jgi:hypothetical protein